MKLKTSVLLLSIALCTLTPKAQEITNSRVNKTKSNNANEQVTNDHRTSNVNSNLNTTPNIKPNFDSLLAITPTDLPNPSDHINGGPKPFPVSTLYCDCTETHWGPCDSDWGEVCGCSWGITAQEKSIAYVPKLKPDDYPFIVYQVKQTNKKETLEGKNFVVAKKIKLSKAIADTLGVSEAFVMPGVYKFNKDNAISLPLIITITPNSPLYHAVNEKGHVSTSPGPDCKCDCCVRYANDPKWYCCPGYSK